LFHIRMIRDPRSRLSTVLREALPWRAFAHGDPLALCLIEGYGRPSLADEMPSRDMRGDGAQAQEFQNDNRHAQTRTDRSLPEEAHGRAPRHRSAHCRQGRRHRRRSATKKGLGTMWTRRSLSIAAKDGIVSKEPDGQQLEQVKKALTRIDMGTYGMSEVSGKPIPLDRLEAVPSTTTLVNEESA